MDNKNLLVAFVASFAIICLSQTFFAPSAPNDDAHPKNSAVSEVFDAENSDEDIAYDHHNHIAQHDNLADGAEISRDNQENFNKNYRENAADQASNRAQLKIEPIKITINSNEFCGDFTINGNEFSGFSLKKFNKSVEEKKPFNMTFDGKYKFSLAFNTNFLRNEKIAWKLVSGHELSPKTPVLLRFTSQSGVTFEREISIDDKFLISVKTKIINGSSENLKIAERSEITKDIFDGDSLGSWILNEGAIGYMNSSLISETFETIQKDSVKSYNGVPDWCGITDKYWLCAFLNSDKKNLNFTYKTRNIKKSSKDYIFDDELSAEKSGNHMIQQNLNTQKSHKNALKDATRYENLILSEAVEIAPLGEAVFESKIFLGPKDVEVLDYYEDLLKIEHFDLALDYGYLSFITKPLLYALRFITDWTNNIAIAILLLTVVLKLFLFPFANKSFKSMAKMKKIQPKIKNLQTIYANDKARLGQEMMDLYRREKVNPLGGCLPTFIQFPLLFALYKVLLITINLRHAEFLWIQDLSQRDPYSVFNLFGLLPFECPDFLNIGIWPILMGITMYLQQKMSPQVAQDKSQERMFMMMPIIFTFMMSSFQVALIIYWTFSNILTIIQQYYIMKNEK